MRSNLTHKERYFKPSENIKYNCNDGVDIMIVENVIERNVCVKKLTIKKDTQINDNSVLTLEDFKIENLQASGAIKGLKMYGTKPNIKDLENELIEFEKTIDENFEKIENEK